MQNQSASCFHSTIQVNPASDASSDFPPIRIHASTPDSSNWAHSPTHPHAHGGSLHPHLRLEPQSPQQLQHSQPLKKGLGRKNILNFTTHIAAQPSKVGYNNLSTRDYTNHHTLKPSKRKRLESTRVTEERLSKRRRLTFDQTDMDWLKIELRDIKFEISEVRSSMIEIAERLHTVEDDHLEHILFPV
jgi:hypothetical protein